MSKTVNLFLDDIATSNLSQQTKIEIIGWLYAEKQIEAIEYQKAIDLMLVFESLIAGNINSYPLGLLIDNE